MKRVSQWPVSSISPDVNVLLSCYASVLRTSETVWEKRTPVLRLSRVRVLVRLLVRVFLNSTLVAVWQGGKCWSSNRLIDQKDHSFAYPSRMISSRETVPIKIQGNMRICGCKAKLLVVASDRSTSIKLIEFQNVESTRWKGGEKETREKQFLLRRKGAKRFNSRVGGFKGEYLNDENARLAWCFCLATTDISNERMLFCRLNYYSIARAGRRYRVRLSRGT